MSLHKSLYVKIGATIGWITGLERGWYVYWEHFKEETWIRVVDAVIVCVWTTLIGTLLALTITLVWNNRFKKTKDGI
jgi:hypothetical protein